MRKFIYFAAAAALVLASCSKNETSVEVNSALNHAVGFNTYSPKSLTKAGGSLVTGTDFSEVDAANQVIGVYAWQHTMDFADATSEPDFMGIGEAGATKVTLAGNGAAASANYTPTKYWPTDESNLLTFAAYYPYGGSGITAPTTTTGWSGLEYGFGVNGTDPKDHVDFMLADIVPDDTYSKSKDQSGTLGAVKFTFRHQLTKVLFKVAFSDEIEKNENGSESGTTITLTSLSFKAKAVGTRKMTYDATNGTVYVDWSVTGDDKTYTVCSNLTKKEAGYVPTDDAAASSYLMIPQKGAVATVKYTVTYNDGASTTNSVDIALDRLTATNDIITEWLANRFITYTITLGAVSSGDDDPTGLHPITFMAQVGEWDKLGEANLYDTSTSTDTSTGE